MTPERLDMGIWLASGSERRSQILRDRYGAVHVEALPDVDETPPTGSVSSQVLAICRRKAAAVPYRLGSGNKRKRRSGPSMVGHRKGGIGPGRYPVKASRAIIKVIESAMENARFQYEDIDAEEMVLTHIAAHRGPIRRGWIPRARGRATPSNHYRVNLEVFLEDMNAVGDDLEDDF